MAKINRLARRFALAASVAVVAAMAATVPLKTAAADHYWRGHGGGYRGGYGGGYGGYGGSFYFYSGPRFYYPPAPVYYYPPPPPVYYQPAPVYYPRPFYGAPSLSLGIVLPLR